jgi:hypothetical protein
MKISNCDLISYTSEVCLLRQKHRKVTVEHRIFSSLEGVGSGLGRDCGCNCCWGLGEG